MSGAADAPGWYPFRASPQLAEWDGTVWTGATGQSTYVPALPGPPTPFAFCRERWFAWIVVGQVLVLLPALVSGWTGNAWWSLLSVPGYAAAMVGGVLVVVRYLRLDQVERLGRLTLLGIGCGLAGFAVGLVLELTFSHTLGIDTTLWLAGPIEEGAKLLVPFLLLIFASRRFADPRVGLYLVLVSGATFGTIEGAEYETRPTPAWAHLELAIVRPGAEMLHVFLTGFAAAVIWLAAWRRGRAFTRSGIGAFALAAGIHSFHDGLATFFHFSTRQYNQSLAHTFGTAVQLGLSALVPSLAVAAALYLLARHAIRELTPPGEIDRCPPHWRPQVRQWGCDRAPAGSPVGGTWDPYGHGPAYGPAYVGVYGLNSPGATPTYPPAPVATPPPSPVGWYPVQGEPGMRAWWDGSAWTGYIRWDGFAWRPT